MKQNGRGNALLVELLIVVLFFMLAATTLMEIFGAAKQNSNRASMCSEALLQTQNIAESLYAADSMEDSLAAMGFTQEMNMIQEGEYWLLHCDGYNLVATYRQEKTDAGLLHCTDLIAYYDGEELFALPATRYASGEVQP